MLRYEREDQSFGAITQTSLNNAKCKDKKIIDDLKPNPTCQKFLDFANGPILNHQRTNTKN